MLNPGGRWKSEVEVDWKEHVHFGDVIRALAMEGPHHSRKRPWPIQMGRPSALHFGTIFVFFFFMLKQNERERKVEEEKESSCCEEA